MLSATAQVSDPANAVFLRKTVSAELYTGKMNVLKVNFPGERKNHNHGRISQGTKNYSTEY
ncbi:hypothetical protein BWQ96_10615 [Gracilariopsis chorda]|uniref:Uncharacterized protein n=1 Tax=Gracilariopsis chorda TaxID=448386 RepID=A0A2V3IC85_9FLOR|nr:hypothetical protein BWQ96_10615 [Gracilariopsis chorda]|eukprot:PXF39681.1 hypothetical protein BWQ96_10615 [Gracilariopsis chorda]